MIMYRRIRDLREDRDLLQKDLAQLLHCTQICYSNYEMGKRDIPTHVLIRLAEYYGTSTDYLLGVTDVRTPYPAKKRLERKHRPGIPCRELPDLCFLFTIFL